MPVWVRAAPPRYEPCLPPSRAAKLFVSHKPVFGSFPPVLDQLDQLEFGLTSLLGKRVLLLNFDRANLQVEAVAKIRIMLLNTHQKGKNAFEQSDGSRLARTLNVCGRIRF
uniref:Uncharacterized protein n=1 Tax=Cucumis melo TaxID=3656 RepID=A0A9I9EM07_CUCME